MTTPTSARSAPRRRETPSAAPRTLALGPVRLSVSSNDPGAAEWLSECLTPWFRASAPRSGGWRVAISASEGDYAELCDLLPADAPRRACFAFDQFVLSLPTWTAGDRVMLADAQRSCFLGVAPGEARLIADPGSRRWRITALWLVLEIAATALRRSHLDLHAASVAHAGRAVLIAGPKGAGKTTLALHLLRSGRCRWIANDRVWVGGEPAIPVVGMPLAVRIRSSTAREFPELFRGIPPVPRPYLYTLTELARATPEDASGESPLAALSPAQLLRQMNVEPAESAPLGAIVFPRIDARADGWTVQRLEPAEVRTELRSNVYGLRSGRREATLFETIGGDPAPRPTEVPNAVGERVPGYRVVLGPNAYDKPDFATRLLESLGP